MVFKTLGFLENDPVKQGFLQDMTLIIYGTEHKPGVHKKDASYKDFECHKECVKGCTGPSNFQCSDCENFFYIHDDKKVWISYPEVANGGVL